MNKEAIKWSLSFLLLVATFSISAFLIVQNEELKRQNLTIKNEMLSLFEKKNNVTGTDVVEPGQKLQTPIVGNYPLLIPLTGKYAEQLSDEDVKIYWVKNNSIYRGSKKLVDLQKIFDDNSYFSEKVQFKKDEKIDIYFCHGFETCLVYPKHLVFDPKDDSYITQTNNFFNTHYNIVGARNLGFNKMLYLFMTTTPDNREVLGIYDIKTDSEEQLAIIDPEYTLFYGYPGGNEIYQNANMWFEMLVDGTGKTNKEYILVRPLPKKFGAILPEAYYK